MAGNTARSRGRSDRPGGATEMQSAQSRFLPDGRRLHLHHGPIDIVLDVSGPGRSNALAQAEERFGTIMEELVAEIAAIRSPVTESMTVQGVVARRMLAAVTTYMGTYVTPMAAVAGAVADEVLDAACANGGIRRAYANNGGDVALYLASDAQLTGAICGALPGWVTISGDSSVRGVATSGWRGRSHSLGIADSVTVLARCSAEADAAATLIANAVDLPGNSKIVRQPACCLSPDSDLGDWLVTVDVGPLSAAEISNALSHGTAFAADCHGRGLIMAAYLTLGGQFRTVGSAGLIDHQREESFHA